MSCKLLQNEKITSNHTSIVMGNLVPATYFLKVYAVVRDERIGVVHEGKEFNRPRKN
jgi:hypothetical protein